MPPRPAWPAPPARGLHRDHGYNDVGEVARGMIQIYRALGGGWQLRLEELAASGQCCKPLQSVDGGMCDDYIGKQPPGQRLPLASM